MARSSIDAFTERVRDVYDVKRGRFTSATIPIVGFMVGMLAVFIVGLILNLPLMAFFSNVAFVLGLIALVEDHWILNSIVIPLFPLFLLVFLDDMWGGNTLGGLYHALVVVMFAIILLRKDTSFVIMMLSGILIAAWIYSVKAWSTYPYYNVLFGVYIDPGSQFLMMSFLSVIISFLITAKNIAMARQHGRPFDCDGGKCPL